MGLKLSKGLKSRNKKIYDNLPNSSYDKFNHSKRLYNQREYYNNNQFPRYYNKEKEFSQYKRDILNYSLPLHYEQICEILQGNKQIPTYVNKTKNPDIQNIISQPILIRYSPNDYKNFPQLSIPPILHQAQHCVPQNLRHNHQITNRIPCKKCLACPKKCYKAAFSINKPKLIFEEIHPLQTSQKKIFNNNEFSDKTILEKIKKVNFELNSSKSKSYFS